MWRPSLRVLLVDDHQLFRAGLQSLFTAWGHEVVGNAGDGAQAVAMAKTLKPDLVLMDINLPKLNGLEATRLIKAEMPAIKIVMVTVSDDQSDLFEAIKSGAEGYLLKNMSEDEFRKTMEAISRGEPPLSPGLALQLLQEFGRLARGDHEKADAPRLTERETEVLRMVASGSTNREIAASLVISEHTAAFHVKNIFSKLHTTNRTQTVAYAIKAGLVTPPDGSTR
jgi:DNA-binding NarL/FixJ family response regulator